MLQRARRSRHPMSVLAVLALFAATAVQAQEGGAPPPPPPADPPADETPATEPQSLQPAPAPAAPAAPVGTVAAPGLKGASAFTWGDSTGIVLPPLADIASAVDLDAQYESWRKARGESESRMLKARERSLRWKSQVELQKSQIELLSKQIGAAKKEKREGEKKDAEARKKREEQKRDYYESMRQVNETGADYYKAQFDLAQARVTQIEQEKRLQELWSKGGYDTRVSSESRALEQRVLTMAKDGASLLSTLADKERAFADKSLGALKLWSELQK